MSDTENMIWILERISSMEIYFDDIEAEYVAEVKTIGKQHYFICRADAYSWLIKIIKQKLKDNINA